MRNLQKIDRPAGVPWPAAGRLMFLIPLILLLPWTGVQAVEMASLYTAEVGLDAEQEDPRAAAYLAALSQVLLRVSGPELASDAEAIARLFPDPGAYVVQFRSGADDALRVSFDGEAIEGQLQRSGETVWGRDRPLTLVWLAVDWGQGEREILGADDPERTIDEARSIDRNRLLRQRVVDMAERRGLPIVFPLLDTEDLEKVSFSDIWGGFDEQLLEASQRYDVASILIGRIRPESGQLNRWTYYFADAIENWDGEPEFIMNLVADQLSAEFAIGGSAPLALLELRVAGIDSVSAYGSMQKLLAQLAIVESFSILAVDGDQIRYRVESHGGAERLRRALVFNGLLEEQLVESGALLSGMPEATLEFYFQADQTRP